MMIKDPDDISLRPNQEDRFNGNFFDTKVVLTGELLQVARQDASMFILKLGGFVATVISEHTDIVVVGDNPDIPIMELVTEVNKFRIPPIYLMFEDEFVDIIDNHFDIGAI